MPSNEDRLRMSISYNRMMGLASLSPKSLIKRHPRVFDLIIRIIKRGLMGRRDPLYDVLDRFSRSHGGGISFVQIGANDGLRNDPIREFIVRDEWMGVLIEPLPPVFEMLRQNYAYLESSRKLTFENAAISSTGAPLAFYTASGALLKTLPLEGQLDLLRKSSCSREHLAQFVSNPSDVVRVETPSATVEAMIQRHFAENAIDLLVIDAEGHEAVILRSLDFDRTRIGAILFECDHLGPERKDIFGLLEKHGYAIDEIKRDAFASLKSGDERRTDTSLEHRD
jgi:FkbM family methyltransferase